MEKDNILVSVIIPIYNKKKYLENIFQDLEKQTLKKYECIVIDDGSTDGSGELCDQLLKNDTRFRVCHIDNGGVSNARNVGLDMAQGEYITFIDADDRITEEYLENLYYCITSVKVDLVISGYKKVWENSDRIEVSKMRVQGLINMEEILPYFAEWQKESGIFGYCWAKIFSRKLCKNIYFDTSLRLAEDFDFYLKLYRRVKTIYFDEKQNYLYLQEAQNSSVADNDYDIDYKAQLKINLRYKEFLGLKNEFYGKNKKIVTILISNYFYFSLFYCDMSQFKSCFEELHNIYIDKKVEFITERNFAKLLLFLLKHNREKEVEIIIKLYRKIRKYIRR